jgi:hypothetical protein
MALDAAFLRPAWLGSRGLRASIGVCRAAALQLHACNKALL